MAVTQASPLEFVETLEGAATLLEPIRLRLVRELAEPASAASLGKKLGLPRQRLNYHLRTLEEAGFVRLVEERRKRNCTERILQATARAYIVSPAVLAELGSDEPQVRDCFSWAYLVASAARVLRDLGILRRRADAASKKLATLTIETELRLASPERLHAFGEELAFEIARLTAKYHDEKADGGRILRVLCGAYPAITKNEGEAACDRAP